MVKATVLIVDDEPKVLDSLERLLKVHGYAVETFSSATSLLARIPSSGPCCAIVDVKMPGRSGLDLQAQLSNARPGLPVIFITGYGDVPAAVHAIKAGASDFLTKPVEEVKLIAAVRRALAEEQRFRQDRNERAGCLERFATLTAREKEVCALVADGKLNKQIAAELGTCEKTIKVHRGRVMKKMRAESLADLVRMFVKIRTPVPMLAPPPAMPPAPSKRPDVRGRASTES